MPDLQPEAEARLISVAIVEDDRAHREWRKDISSASEVFARLEDQLDSHLRDVRGSD